MRGNIIGESVDGYVKSEIDIRQNVFGLGTNPSNARNTDFINYLNNRTAWIKFASSIKISEKGQFRLPTGLGNEYLGNILAKNSILFNGFSQLKETSSERFKIETRGGVNFSNTLFNNNAYGIGGSSNQGLVPMPGISSLTVQSKNRGSINTANIKITAYNRFQFELIELLYLRLGYTMLLEWGWDKRIIYDKDLLDTNFDGKINILDSYTEEVGNTFTETGWFDDNIKTHTQALNKIKGYRQKYNGNYDGFCGKVKNFSWSFGNDGSYDISIDLVSLGDVIESLRANVPSTEADKNKIYQIQKKVDNLSSDSSLLANAGNDKISTYLFTTLVNQGNESFFNSENSPYFDIALAAKSIATAQDSTRRPYNYDKIDGDFRYYVTFGEIIRLIQTLVVPNLNREKQLKFDIDVDRTIFESKPLLFPNDPRICIARMTDHHNLYYDYYGSYVKKPIFMKNMKKSLYNTGNSEDFSERFIYYKLFNVYLNYHFVFECLKSNTDKEGNISLFKLLEKLCDGVNKSFCNSPKIEPIIKEDKKITFIDQNTNPNPNTLTSALGISTTSTATLEVMGFNQSQNKGSFLKDVKFNTKITPKLASQISIGATATGTSLTENSVGMKNWNKGLIDRFQTDISNDTEATSGISNNVTESGEEEGTSESPPETEISETITRYTGTNSRYITSGGEGYTTNETFPYEFTLPYETGGFRFNLNTGGFGAHVPAFKIIVKVDTAGKVTEVKRSQQSVSGRTYPTLSDKGNRRLQELKEIMINGSQVSDLIGIGGSGAYSSTQLMREFEIALQNEFDVIFGVSETRLSNEELSEEISGIGNRSQLVNDENRDLDANGDGIVTANERIAQRNIDQVEEKRNKVELAKAANNLITYFAFLFGSQSNYNGVYINIEDIKYLPTPNNGKYYSLGKSSYESYLISELETQYQSHGVVSDNIGFIPLEFSLTSDGISGLKHYQKLNINQSFLPKNYGESLNFLIKGISHKIDSSGWETTIDTLSTPRSDKSPVKLPPPEPVVQTTSTDNDATYQGEDIEYNPETDNTGGEQSDLLKTITSGYSLVRKENFKFQSRHKKTIKRLTKGKAENLIYFPEVTTKRAVIIHFTAGWSKGDNAESSIRSMVNKDVSFPLGVHYFITMGGHIEYVFDERYWSNHSSVGNNDKGSIGIELQNLGYFHKDSSGYFRKSKGGGKDYYLTSGKLKKYGKRGYEFGDADNKFNPDDFVYDFGSGRGYRGYQYYHKHSTPQLNALQRLLQGINQRHNIPLAYNGSIMFPSSTPKNPSTPTAKNKYSVPGIYTHGSNYSKGDTYPDPNLVAMLKSLT